MGAEGKFEKKKTTLHATQNLRNTPTSLCVKFQQCAVVEKQSL